jgi:hypothetical protein
VAVHQGPASATAAVQVAVDQVTGAAVVAYTGDPASGPTALYATRQCIGISAVSGTSLIDDCVVSQPTTPVLPGSQCPGPQVTDTGGDALSTSGATAGSNLEPLDLLNAQLAAPDATQLQASITVNRLSTTLPTGLTRAAWRLTWTQGAVRRYVQATLAPAGAWAYSGGVLAPDGTLTGDHPVHASVVPGANGGITFALPGATVGLASGAQLQDVSAASYATFSGSGSSAAQAQLVDRAPDGGSGATYTVAQVCAPASAVPDVPAVAAIPMAGALGGLLYTIERRRRTRRTQP